MPHPSLDRRITIQSATETQDAAGQPIPAWAAFITDLPAQYMPVSGAEQFQAQQVLARMTARWRIRYRTDITREMRLIFESQTFDIRAIEADMRFDRRQYSVITAELVPAP